MHFSNILLLPLLLQGVAAAPTQDATTALDTIDGEQVIVQNFRAADGETYQILINAAFANETAASDTTAVEKRQTGVNDWGEFHKMSTHQDQCRASSFIGDTGPHAPTTGRCKALQDWADNNGGYFETIYGRHIWGDKKHWLIKTFPGGGNACAFWVRHAAYKARIGNLDLKDLIRDSLSKFTRNFNGVYRMRARGVADCNGDLVKGGSVAYEWWVDNE